jgi:hypothetical protein
MTWAGFLLLVGQLLERLLDYIETAKREARNDQVHADPGAAFDKHFRVPAKTDPAASAKPANDPASD